MMEFKDAVFVLGTPLPVECKSCQRERAALVIIDYWKSEAKHQATSAANHLLECSKEQQKRVELLKQIEHREFELKLESAEKKLASLETKVVFREKQLKLMTEDRDMLLKDNESMQCCGNCRAYGKRSYALVCRDTASDHFDKQRRPDQWCDQHTTRKRD